VLNIIIRFLHYHFLTIIKAKTGNLSLATDGCQGLINRAQRLHTCSNAGTNLKVGAHIRRKAQKFLVVPLHFFGSTARQLVVLVSAFVMEIVWSVLCLLFYLRCPRPQPFVKVGARALWSRRHCIHS